MSTIFSYKLLREYGYLVKQKFNFDCNDYAQYPYICIYTQYKYETLVSALKLKVIVYARTNIKKKT